MADEVVACSPASVAADRCPDAPLTGSAGNQDALGGESHFGFGLITDRAIGGLGVARAGFSNRRVQRG